MAAIRRTPTKAIDGPTIGEATYATRVNEEVSALWQRGADTLGSIGGTANAITASASVALTAYAVGNLLWLTPSSTNTAAVTLNVDGLGARAVRDAAGAALTAGMLQSGVTYLLYDNGSHYRIIGGGAVGASNDPIFILATGQSNLVQSPTGATTPPSNAFKWNNVVNSDGSVGTAFVALSSTNTNLAERFAAKVAEANPHRTVYLLNVSFGGQDISHWLVGASAPDVYDNILDNITPALAAAGMSQISVELFWQGESDAAAPTTWVADAETFHGRLRLESWYPINTPVIVFGVTTEAVTGNAVYRNFNNYVQQFVYGDPDHRQFIYPGRYDSNYWDMTPIVSDGVHMNASGYEAVSGDAARVYVSGPRRLVPPGMNHDPETGFTGLGIAVPFHKADVEDDNPARGLVARVRNRQTSAPTGAMMAYSQAGVASWAVGIDASGSFAWYVNRTSLADGTFLGRLDGNGRLSLGRDGVSTLSAVSTNSMQVHSGTAADGFTTVRWDNVAGGPQLHLLKSRSGTVGTHAVVQNGDVLGNIFWGGSDGAKFVQAAQIIATVNGTPGTDDMPGAIVMGITADGGNTVTNRLVLTNGGGIGTLRPNANDGTSLGVAGVAWADLYLATGGVVDFGNGNLTVTGASNQLSVFSSLSADFRYGGATELGSFKDKGNGTRLHKVRDRFQLGDGCADDGTTAPSTYISAASLGGWHTRGAQGTSLSTNGGTGFLAASRSSDRYTWLEPTAQVWQATTLYATNDVVCWAGNLYEVTTGGTTGGSPPTHTVGTVANGTAQLLFLDFSYVAPIGLSSVIVNDQRSDGTGVWARYALAARMSSIAGTTYGEEMDVANFGDDVVNNPYSRFPAGSTIGYWIAAGYDSSILSSANPSTCAILIGSGADLQLWNKGIVFQDGSFVGPVIASAEGQEVAWYVSGGTKRGAISYASSYLTFTGAVTGYSFDQLIAPAASDGAAIGSTTRMWSDLFLASGAVVNFNNGDVLLTHSANSLTMTGGALTQDFTSAMRLINSTDGASNQGLRVESDRATPTDGDVVYVSAYLSDDAGNQDEMARITFRALDVSATTEDADITWGIMVAGSLTNKMVMDSTALRPQANDGLALGTATTMWADLFLASGAAVNWNNGDITLQHSANALTWAGGVIVQPTPNANFASIRFPTGGPPSAPTDGDMWREDNTDTGLKIRINGVTKTIVVS